MFDLDAYLERVQLRGPPELAGVHRSHVLAIPFENLDPHRGVRVSLDPEALQRKLVAERRGGYCFEHNLLLKAALEALGAQVEPMLARVRWGAPPGTLRPLSHLVLRVGIEGAVWHADVGFGAGTLLEPIPFGPGGPYEQAGWCFRVVEDEHELVLQTEADQEWRDVYAFAPRPVAPIDIEVSNWFTSTHPASAFVTGLIVSRQQQDGTRVTLSDWNELALVVHRPRDNRITPVERQAVPQILGEQFGLPGFALNDAGRIVRSGEARLPSGGRA